MMKMGFTVLGVFLSLALPLCAQIDPVQRDLVQLGYDQPFEGRSPIGAYAFYYHNQPDFLRTNVTLRLAVAPVYLDSELGFTGLLGPNTDVGIGLAGAVLPMATRKSAMEPISSVNRLTGTAWRCQPACIICSIPPTGFR